MKHLKDMNETLTVVDKLADALALACIKEINGGLDLKIFKIKTRNAIVEEMIDYLLQNNKAGDHGYAKFTDEDKLNYKRNKTQLMKEIMKEILS
jgi:hypothetical protein